MEIFLQEYTYAPYFCTCKELCLTVLLYQGCQEEILDGPDSTENIVKMNPVHLGGPAGLMQTGARCWLSTGALRREGKHSPNET